MLNNIFSSFDFKNFFFFTFLIVNFIYILRINIYFRIDKLIIVFKLINIFLNENISKNKILINLFYLIYLINLLSLNTFSFSLTRQINVNVHLILIF